MPLVSSIPQRCSPPRDRIDRAISYALVMTKPTHEDRLAKWAREGKPGTKPVAAATVILLRDTDDGIETLMLRRNSKIAFGGMWVFPGGRVDDADREGLADDDELGAARRAAAREAHEEAGLVIDVEGLVPFSHWTPPPITPKRFLTWFFLARAPERDVVIDEGEIHEHLWMGPRSALDRRDARQIELAPPTWISLHTLAAHANVEDALSQALAREPEHFQTHISVGGLGPVALWHGDAGWESSDADVPGRRHRLSMLADRWRYERSDPQDD